MVARVTVLLSLIVAIAIGAMAQAPEVVAQATPSIPSPPPMEVDPTRFVETVDNLYFPLEPGTTLVYDGMSEDGPERVEVTVTSDTKTILGVECVVVRDRVFINDELVEDTLDWFAQDTEGSVWYFGEASADYESGEVVSTDGSWEAGIEGALPGIVMPADPIAGAPYYQEYAPGVAEDIGQVIAAGETVTVPYGAFSDVVVTRDTNPLEPGPVEHKSYAPSVGLVLEETVEGGSERIELVEVRREGSATPTAGLTG